MRICPICSATYPTQVGFCPKDGSPLGELHDWVPGATIRGKYRILSMIGKGGMGSVYKALHLGFDELRALKLLNRELTADARFVKRFKQEAFTTRKLQHPNIVRVEDIDETEEGQPLIVMEYIEGRNLRSLMEQHNAMKVAAACSIAKQVASALVVAHGLGVIHRDLKPDNIVLVAPAKAAGTPAEPTVKVLDFGIAKLKEARAEANPNDSGLTLPGFLLGTPQYMSPEQAKGKRGDELDGRSDIYSLGILMYQMLTGTLPFEATTTMEMLLAHVQQAPKPILSLRADLQIPGPVASIVMQCLEKDREARPQSAQALIESLERAQSISTNAARAPEAAVPPAADRDREATQLRERQAALAQEQEIALAREREAQEREAAAAREKEAALAREQQAALAREREAQEHEAREREAALAAAQSFAGPSATAMVPKAQAEVHEVPPPPLAAVSQEPSPEQGHASPALPRAMVEKPGESPALRIVWIVALAGVVLVAFSFLMSRRHAAAPDSGVTIKMTPAKQAASPVTPTPAPAQNGNSDQARLLELREKISAIEREGDAYQTQGKYDEAIHTYETGLKLDPENSTLLKKVIRAKHAKLTEAGTDFRVPQTKP